MGDLAGCLCGSHQANRQELREAAPLLQSLHALTLGFSRRYKGVACSGKFFVSVSALTLPLVLIPFLMFYKHK